MGHLLNNTEGMQKSKTDMPIANAKKRISAHVRNIALSMEQHQEMARYFFAQRYGRIQYTPRTMGGKATRYRRHIQGEHGTRKIPIWGTDLE